MKKIFLSILILLTTLASAEEGMETDRPDFTEGVKPVESGRFQIESGYTYTRFSGGSEHTLPEGLLRIGVSDGFEARVGLPGYSTSRDESEEVAGILDTSLGFKYEFWREIEGWPDLSMIGELSLPTGANALSAETFEPGVKMLWAYGFSDFGLSGNVNLSGPETNNERYLELATSLAIGTDITERWGVYGEFFTINPLESSEKVSPNERYLNGGVTYRPKANIQLDFRVGTGLNEASADLFFGPGLSILF
jgi:hypothetical protein